MKLIKNIGIVILGVLAHSVLGQQRVIYNGKTFKPAEVIETQVGNRGETFSFKISEIDMSPNGDWAKQVRQLQSQGKDYNPKDAPKPLSLLLSVNFKKTFKFPITEADSVYVSLSSMKENILEDDFYKNQIESMDITKIENEGKSLQTQKKSLEEASMQISKLLQEGKITPEEAIQKIEALTQPYLNELDNSSIMHMEHEEFNDNRPTFDIMFSNAPNNTEAIPFKGTLHIVEFNSNKLVAYFKGVHFVECTDVARANDPSKPCKKVESGLFSNHKVLSVEDINITINSSFKTFYDNRN